MSAPRVFVSRLLAILAGLAVIPAVQAQEVKALGIRQDSK